MICWGPHPMLRLQSSDVFWSVLAVFHPTRTWRWNMTWSKKLFLDRDLVDRIINGQQVPVVGVVYVSV